MVTRAGVYTRISKDDGTALGVARQREDCLREATRRGWDVIEVFTDNDVSATKSKVRPSYKRMVEAIEQGHLDALIVWDVDRLTRTPRELEDFIDLADARGLALASCAGEIDLATSQGRMMARMKGTVARYEVDQLKRRLKRKYVEIREQGLRHGGPVPFGYRRVNGRDVPDEVTAHVVRELYRRVIDGESLRSLAKELTDSGNLTPRGNPWTGRVIGQMLRKPGYAGLMTYQGEVIGKGNWEALVHQDVFDTAVAILSDPSRIPARGREVKYLGSGVYRCGRDGCGRHLRPVVYRGKRKPTYACPHCMKVSRLVASVDEVVEAVVVARLSRPDLLRKLRVEGGELQAALQARDAVLARMDTLADQYAEGTVTDRQFARINEKHRAALARAEAAVKTMRASSAIASIAGPDAAASWRDATLDRRRAVLRELVDVVVLPSGPGQKFDRDQVRFDWKRPA